MMHKSLVCGEKQTNKHIGCENNVDVVDDEMTNF